MLIDEVSIRLKGGDGGNGVASFKNPKMSHGPTGGDGGKGGDVYLEGVSDLSALRQFRHKKRFAAKNGVAGGKSKQDGAAGEDLVLKVPVGTVARNNDLNLDYEITKVGQRVLVAHGAKGGHGNFYFRSSTNITPTEWEPGHKAREFGFTFELKLIADVGLIGLPNAGKSSLLNALTNAKSKVANYRFTTLEPALGSYYGLILADIPGLIEGAHEGKGLGIKFLRHISRCTLLFHLVSAESSDPESDYRAVRAELSSYDPNLSKKPEYVFLSKSDIVDPDQALLILKKLKKVAKSAQLLSILDDALIKNVKLILSEVAREKGLDGMTNGGG